MGASKDREALIDLYRRANLEPDLATGREIQANRMRHTLAPDRAGSWRAAFLEQPVDGGERGSLKPFTLASVGNFDDREVKPLARGVTAVSPHCVKLRPARQTNPAPPVFFVQ